jgi:multisubunit Na+/H+ antiporter MnhF subunit
MNAFLVAATALLAGLLPCAVIAVRADVMDAVIALQLAGSTMVLVFICLGEGFARSSYFNLPVVCALLTWISGLVFARFLGRFV